MKNLSMVLGLSILILSLFLCAGVKTVQAGPIIKISDTSWLMINYEMQLYGQWRDTGSGRDRTDDTTDIYFRRNRLIFRGQATDTFGFAATIQHQGDKRIHGIQVTDIPGENFDILDAFMTADFSDEFRLVAGLTKDRLVREHNEGCFFPLSVDRSLFVYTPLPRLSRDYGVVLWGNLFDAKAQYRLAVMKGNDEGNDPKNSLRYTGRVHINLLDPEVSLFYRGTYLGKKKVLTFGAGYQIEPDAVYGNLAAGTLEKDYQAWTVDGFFEYPTSSGTFTFSAAYLELDFDDAFEGADPDPRSIGINGEKNGWYVKAGYMLPNKVGPGKVQVFARYEDWNLAQLEGVFDQEITWYAGGVNYFINGQNLRITLEYSQNDFDKENDTVEDFKTVTTMLQFLF